jgi:G3E family GTPase
VVVETQGVVDIEILDLWLGQLARSRHPLLLRMKGILAVADSDRSFVFNAVRSVIDVRPGRLWGSESRYSRIVFIGKGLDKATLEAGFDACLPTEPPNPDG